MAAAPFVVQPYNREIVFKAGALMLCKTEEEAREVAAAIVGGGRAHGAVVFSNLPRDVDETTVVIACEGDVPCEVADIGF